MISVITHIYFASVLGVTEWNPNSEPFHLPKHE
jgi:hypothetical protein